MADGAETAHRVVLFAVGGTLFLDSAEYVMRIAFITSQNVEWFSLGSWTALISLLLVGLGLYFLFEPAIVPGRRTAN